MARAMSAIEELSSARVEQVGRNQMRVGGQRECANPGDSGLFDEDALSGTFLGRFGDSISGAPNLIALLHVGETVVQRGKDSRRDLLAQAITGAQILIDPHLHWLAPPSREDAMSEPER